MRISGSTSCHDNENKVYLYNGKKYIYLSVLVSIVVSIPACHAGDRGSIPRRGAFFFLLPKPMFIMLLHFFNFMSS